MKNTVEQKAKRNNMVDMICDEIYGAAEHQDLLPDHLVILKTAVRKLAKRVGTRWMIGPR